MRSAIARSKLFTPGTNGHQFARAAASAADLVVLDLEDSVADEAKDRARDVVADALSSDTFARRRCGVRINGLDSRWWLDDLLAVTGPHVDEIHLPKVDHPRHLTTVADALAAITGRADGPPTLVATIESAAAIQRVDAIARATPRLAGLQLGMADLALDLGFAPDPTRSGWVRARVVVAAASVGVPAYDAAHLDHADLDGFRTAAAEARRWGMAGKSCIHPDQVPVANEVFRPTPDELARAREVVDAFEQARVDGHGVASLDGRMVDRPVVEHARRILEFE